MNLLLLVAVVSLANAGFDQIGKDGSAAGWNRLPNPHYRAADDVGLNGSAGLLFENRAATNLMPRVSQRIQLKAGRSYRASAWVRTEDVICTVPNGPSRWGVCVGLMWFDEKGKRLGQDWSSPAQGKGVRDWREISVQTEKMPADIAYAEVFVSCINPSTGLAQIDKINVEEVREEPVGAVYCSSYRNLAWEGDVSFFGALDLEGNGIALGDARVEFSYVDADGTRKTVPGRLENTTDASVTLPVAGFAFGTNEVTCVLRDAAGKELGRAACPFVRTREMPRRKVWFDRFGRCVVDGKLFFPLGMYDTDTLFGKHNFITRFAESRFNTVMCYRYPNRAQVDALAAIGVTTIYPVNRRYTEEEGVKDGGRERVNGILKELGGHPAIIAWYANDERPLSQVPLLEARYRQLAESDPDRPVWSVQDIYPTVRKYMPTFDVMGGDPYPIAQKPVSLMIDAMREQRRQMFDSRPIWQVPQAFSWGYQPKLRNIERRPTKMEMLNQAYQAIAGGANGIVFFALQSIFSVEENGDKSPEELWTELKEISQELDSHVSTFLSEPGPALVGEAEDVVIRTWTEDDGVRILLVNATRKDVRGEVALKDGRKVGYQLGPLEWTWR